MMPQGLEPAVEAALLRGVLDNQPICLLRLGTDGVVLSANDAAQTLVGAEGLGEMLGKVFTGWVAPEYCGQWQTFLLQVSQGTPASLQCNLIGPSGVRLPTLLHGVPLDDHPDGIRSIAVAVRNSNAERNTADERRRPDEGQADAEAAVAERQRLEFIVRDLEDRLRRLTAEYEATRRRSIQPTGSQKEIARASEPQGAGPLDEQQILSAVRETSVWHQLEASIVEREVLLKIGRAHV